ncbi:MAG: hypothetical protein L7S67_06355 [Flavobacteriales bacterium]|nr:hypothetical protein [Flavobacteriales bacterium]
MKRLQFRMCVMLSAVLLWAAPEVRAQFDIAPTDSLVDVFVTDSVTRIFQIDFPNTSGDSLALSWRYIDGGWTEGWDVNLCDLGECYTGVPADADMLAMGAEGAGFLKLIVNALEVEGTCFLHFWVWPTGNQDALMSVYFDLRNGGVSNVLNPAPTPRQRQWSAYPVPAAVGQPVYISGPLDRDLTSSVQLLDMHGALTPCKWNAEGQPILQTEGLSKGVYLLIHKDLHPPLRIIME